jgi:hypothetical protein
VEEMAQDVLLTLLRGNEKLCLRLADDEQQRDSVFDLFAFVANSHGQQATAGQTVAAAKKRGKGGGGGSSAGGSPFAEEPLTTCDTSPALDFFFIMCAPTASRPLKDFQARVAER